MSGLFASWVRGRAASAGSRGILVAALLVGCERPSIRLGAGPGADGGASDVGVAADAGVAADGGGTADAGFAADANVRVFTGRVGTALAGELGAFEPEDLTRWRLSARSALGELTPTIDGLGRFSVPAVGRVEVTLIPPRDAGNFNRTVVSTEGDTTELISTWPSRRAASERPPIQLTVELAQPWREGDLLVVTDSVRDQPSSFRDVAVPGATRVERLLVGEDGLPDLEGADVWVTHIARSDGWPPTTEFFGAGFARALDRAALSRPIAIALSTEVQLSERVSWSVDRWRPDVVQTVGDDVSYIAQVVVRADRPLFTAFGLFGPLGGAVRLGARWVLDVYGQVETGYPVPAGYVGCAVTTGFSTSPQPGNHFLLSGVFDCRRGTEDRRLNLDPAEDVRLDGIPLGAAEQPLSMPFTLSWRAPSVGPAHGYEVLLTTNGPTAEWVRIVTDATEVTVPEGLLGDPEWVAPALITLQDYDRPPVRSPLTRSAYWQQQARAYGTLRRVR